MQFNERSKNSLASDGALGSLWRYLILHEIMELEWLLFCLSQGSTIFDYLKRHFLKHVVGKIVVT